IAAVDRDSRSLTTLVMKLGKVPVGVNEDALASDLDDFLSDYGTQSISDFDLSGALNGMVRIIRNHRIILPAKLGMLIKILVMLEGTSQQLNPNFSLAELLNDYKSQAIRRRFSPKRTIRRLRSELRAWTELVERFPRDAGEILDRVKDGSFDVHLDHRRLDTIVNRLVMGILSAALFVGSASLWSRKVAPLISGVSVPGFLGCAVAVWLGFHLIRAVRRSGSLHDREGFH
ncbi:MAG: AarF/ABC1/UbiB kinase family protein, partial [Planctomycetota bacterium]